MSFRIFSVIVAGCSAIIVAIGIHMIALSTTLEATAPIVDVLEAQQELNEELAERPDICGLIDVVCEGEELPNTESRIIDEAVRQGVDAGMAVRIAQCESGLNPYAKNPESSAAGVFQITRATFNEAAERMGESWSYESNVYDIEKNISVAIWLMAQDEVSRWECE